MANQRTTTKTTPPKPAKKTMIGTSASDIAAQARAKEAELQRRAKAMGWKTVAEYKSSGWAQNKSAFKANESKVKTSKSTQSKVQTPTLTEEQKSSIPFKNSTIDKFSEKVYPIWQGLEKPRIIDSKGNTSQAVITAINKQEQKKPWIGQSTMFGTEAQRDSSRAVVTGMNIKKTPGGNIFVYPDKNNPFVKPGNTNAGALIQRKNFENNAQLRANKKLTGKTGGQ